MNKETLTAAIPSPEVSQHERVGGLDIAFGPDPLETDPETGEPIARGYVGVYVTGLWHLSTARIEQFDDRSAEPTLKHGPGLYVGAGANAGDAVEQLRGATHFRHDVAIRGNVLFVPLGSMNDASWSVAERAEEDGLDFDSVDAMAPGRRLNRILREHAVDGVRYDAMILHDEVRPESGEYWVEGVIFNPAATAEVSGIEQVVRDDPN